MTKLEIIKSYPWGEGGLKVEFIDGLRGFIWGASNSDLTLAIHDKHDMEGEYDLKVLHLNHFKPILKEMPDMYKELINEDAIYNSLTIEERDCYQECRINGDGFNWLPQWIFQWFLQEKYNIFNLAEGEFIPAKEGDYD